MSRGDSSVQLTSNLSMGLIALFVFFIAVLAFSMTGEWPSNLGWRGATLFAFAGLLLVLYYLRDV